MSVGLSAGVEKPPVAPKPKLVPPPKPVVHSAGSKPNLNVFLPPKPPVKPAVAPKPCLSKPPPPPLESKPLVCKSEHQTHFQRKTENVRHLGLLNSRNGPCSEPQKPEWDYVIPICVCAKGKCHECSPKENSRRPIQHEKSAQAHLNNKSEGSINPTPRTPTKPQHITPANRGQALTSSVKDSLQGSSSVQPRQTRANQNPGDVKCLANGLIGSKVHALKKQSSAESAQEPSAAVVGSPPKTSNPALTDDKQHLDIPDKQNSSPPSVVASGKKPPPLPIHSKPKNSNSGQLDKTGNASDNSATSAQTGLKAVKLKDATPALSQEGPPIPPIKPPSVENKSTRGVPETQRDEKIYPCWRSPPLKQRQDRTVCCDGPSEEAGKKQQLENEHSAGEETYMKVHKNHQPKLPKPKHIVAKEVHQKPQRNNEAMSGKERTPSEPQHVGAALPVSDEGTFGSKPNQSHSDEHKPNNSTAGNAPPVRPGTALKPKAKSFTLADRLQKKKSFQKVMDLDLPVKKAKGKQALDCTPVKGEQPVQEANRNEDYAQILEYRTHHFKSPSGESVPKATCPRPSLSREQSVDGDDVLGKAQHEHLYEDVPDHEDHRPLGSPGVWSQHRQSSNFDDDGLYEDIPEDCSDTKRYDFLKSNF